jgi:hypothetical protein
MTARAGGPAAFETGEWCQAPLAVFLRPVPSSGPAPDPVPPRRRPAPTRRRRPCAARRATRQPALWVAQCERRRISPKVGGPTTSTTVRRPASVGCDYVLSWCYVEGGWFGGACGGPSWVAPRGPRLQRHKRCGDGVLPGQGFRVQPAWQDRRLLSEGPGGEGCCHRSRPAYRRKTWLDVWHQ